MKFSVYAEIVIYILRLGFLFISNNTTKSLDYLLPILLRMLEYWFVK